MRHVYKLALMLIGALTLASCANNTKLQGTIGGAAGQTIQLQVIGDAIAVVDSVKIAGDGTFALEAPESTEPTFYRAVLPSGKAIVFVADSAETVTVKADAEAADWFSSVAFDNSEESALTMEVVAKAATLQGKLQSYTATESDPAKLAEMRSAIDDYKASIKDFIFAHPRSLASYYALYQNVMGLPVFNINDIHDHVLFSTVATSLNIVSPDEPRVKLLCEDVIQARAIQRKQQQLQEMINNADVANTPDIEMPDKDGKMHKLSSLRGKVVILQFWSATEQASRDNNRQLASLYAKYKSRGLEIYSVSLDTSKLVWEEAMTFDKVTWTSVCDLQGVSSQAAMLYNIRPMQDANGNVIIQVPQLFILDKEGNLIGKNLFGKRLDDRMAEIFR
ncbi:MAG: TlpA family protein disulfide reductase [Bacteroidales bacterium]|nr:TlpA family protein disulfide reductase [Bacteroidales bacterium]